MKKVIFILLFFVPSICNAQIIFEKNEFNEYCIEKNDSKKIINVESSKEQEEAPGLLKILFSAVSIILMVTSNVLFKKNYDIFATLAALVALIFAALAATLFAVFAAFAALIAALAIKKKTYKGFSVIYYILITIHFILLFI